LTTGQPAIHLRRTQGPVRDPIWRPIRGPIRDMPGTLRRCCGMHERRCTTEALALLHRGQQGPEPRQMAPWPGT
jgi:hypothetical protein